jgi:AraC family transcriptional regulator, positive regulator of tynA and feaB
MVAKALQSGSSLKRPRLAYDAWRAAIHSYCGRFNPEGVEPSAFVGRLGPRTICGLVALDISCNSPRIERTQRDVRLDGNENYYVVLQVAGQSTVAQNDRIIGLGVGDIGLIDAARPVTVFCEGRRSQWISLHLPRQSLVSHLGFGPQGGLSGHRSTPAARVLFQLARHVPGVDGSISGPADTYMHLAIYDLLGALFVRPDPQAVSPHTDKLFDLLRSIIKSRFAEPDLGPAEVAVEAGISLRYLQKLFTVRGVSCSHFIQCLRLDHAARILRRLQVLETGRPLSEIAFAVGFRDYAHFSRSFRDRFGCPPGTYASRSRSPTEQHNSAHQHRRNGTS